VSEVGGRPAELAGKAGLRPADRDESLQPTTGAGGIDEAAVGEAGLICWDGEDVS